jgi:hypothetical protein
MQLQYTVFLYKPIYMSVYRTITVSLQTVWPIVLYGKMLLHISVQCRTGTQLFTHPTTRYPQALFYYFPIFRTTNLNIYFLNCSLHEDAWFPTILTKPTLFPFPPYIHTLWYAKDENTKFLFNRRFYEFYLFCENVRRNQYYELSSFHRLFHLLY